jgi:hypothetical protein
MVKIEDIQQYGKEHLETVAASAATLQNGFQAIASAYGDYTKKSFEDTKSFVEKLSGVKSMDKAIWPSRPSSRWKALSRSLRRLPPTNGGSVLSKFKSPALTAGLFLVLERPDVGARCNIHSVRGDVPEAATAGAFLIAGDKNVATGSAAAAVERGWREIRRQKSGQSSRRRRIGLHSPRKFLKSRSSAGRVCFVKPAGID